MNEFERRYLEVTQNHMDLRGVVESMKRAAVIEHFSYTATLGSVASPLQAGVTQSANILMQSDAYFVLQYLMSSVIRPDNPWYALDSGNILIQITDTGAGEVLFSAPAPAAILGGTSVRPQAGIPLLMPVARVIKPNTIVKVDVTQLGTNATDNQQPIGFFVSLLGSRVASY